METEKAYILSEIIKVRTDNVKQLCAAYELKTDVDPKKAILVERTTDNGSEWFFRQVPEWDDPIMTASSKCKAGHLTMLSNQLCPLCMEEQIQNLKTQFAGALELLQVTQFGYARVEKGICIFCQKTKADGHTVECPQGRFLAMVNKKG